MRDNLHRLPQIIATTLALDYMLVDLAGGNVLVAREGDVQVTFIVSEIEIDFTAIVEDVDLTVPGLSVVSSICSDSGMKRTRSV